ncbi:hypothetical protein LX32DRAFT_372235 [Colletotrichum zoysiae]|uniref:Uncharacterized protein n=1 Tax=Colletotrichum zoysiae TaxID=1216348 RepID=A0AAD9M952_9PEZI|nr:hypothetical protein LX32DRAFT_372235 [Colletotrichum zoysiae]
MRMALCRTHSAANVCALECRLRDPASSKIRDPSCMACSASNGSKIVHPTDTLSTLPSPTLGPVPPWEAKSVEKTTKRQRLAWDIPRPVRSSPSSDWNPPLIGSSTRNDVSFEGWGVTWQFRTCWIELRPSVHLSSRPSHAIRCTIKSRRPRLTRDICSTLLPGALCFSLKAMDTRPLHLTELGADTEERGMACRYACRASLAAETFNIQTHRVRQTFEVRSNNKGNNNGTHGQWIQEKEVMPSPRPEGG